MSFTKQVGGNAIRITCLMFAAASIVMGANATRAAESVDTAPQKVVSWKDLDMSSAAGIETLYRRIKSASAEVCGNGGLQSIARAARVRACLDQATSGAIAKVNNPMLTNLYLAKTGKSVTTDPQVAASVGPTH
jgi:UrcA family protein